MPLPSVIGKAKSNTYFNQLDDLKL